MPKYLLPVMLGLALVGAGCDSADSPVSLDKYQTPTPSMAQTSDSAAADLSAQTTPPPTTPPPTPVAAPSSTSQSASSTSTSQPMAAPQESLAFPGVLPSSEITHKNILVKTTKGDFTFELLPNEGPKAASNFVYLTKHKFYDGLTFHRYVPGFVIQGGDPQGSGMGGPGYQFADDKVTMAYDTGIVAMANAGPNTNGSQFFVMLANTPLPPSYSIFGRVISGMDVVQKLREDDVMTSVSVENAK